MAIGIKLIHDCRMEGKYDMKKSQWLWSIVLIALLVLPLLLVMFHHNTIQNNPKPPQQSQNDPQKKSNPQQQTKNNPKTNTDKKRSSNTFVWGVDSANKVDQPFLQCVKKNTGNQ